jgi:uncharacterized SAM-binding protein YcdF (DUF218 family)
VTIVTDREFELPSEEQRARDRELIQALDDHRPVGEQYARTGEVPVSTAQRQPTMRPPVESDQDATPAMPLARPPRRVARRLVQAIGVVLIALVVYGVFSFWQVWSTGRSDQARPVDAIVVMGAAQYDGRPSPQLAARLDHALELWPEALAPMVIVTGGKQEGDRFTEAEASLTYLVDRGVPIDAIVLEGEGTTTYESLRNVSDSVGERVDSVLIVTDPYHALRSRLIADALGFEAFVSPTSSSVVSGANELRRELGEAAGVAVGRIIGFDRLSGLTD